MIGMTVLILIMACALSFLLALSTRFVYEFLMDRFNVTIKAYQDIIFFSYFVWLGLHFPIWKPRLLVSRWGNAGNIGS